MKKIKVVTSLILVMAMLLTGCGKSDATKTETTESNSVTGEVTQAAVNEDTMEETTINIRCLNPITNIEKVEDVFYDKVKDDPVLSKIKLNITYVEGPNYVDKLKLAITAEEDYDLMFVGGWQGLSDFVNDGVFKDVSSYFNNDAYPGLKSAFPEDYVQANTFNGKTYAIPLTEAYEDIKGICYRDDLRVKYNLPEIVDYDTLKQYMDGIAEHVDEEGLTSVWNATSSRGIGEFQNPDYDLRRNNVFKYGASSLGTDFYVALSEDSTKVLNAAVVGDDVANFADFPEKYNHDFVSEWYNNLNDWSKYLNSDRVSNDDESNFGSGLSAVTYSGLSEWLTGSQNIKTVIPDAKLGFFIMDEPQRNYTPGAIVSEMKTWNFLCVPSWSEKTDAVMAFLDWMWSSKENHDLFQYGIEGEDWEAIGDNAYKVLNTESYVMPAYSLTINPTYIRFNEAVVNDEKASKNYEYEYNQSTYTLSPLAGFVFDGSKVESEIATISAYSQDYKFAWAVYGDDTDAKIKEYHDACEAAGLEKIRTELINQIQAFLDAKK